MAFITQEQLAEITGFSKAPDIAVCLDKQGVKYLIGKRGRVFTTMEALNVAMGLPVQPITQISREILEKDVITY